MKSDYCTSIEITPRLRLDLFNSRAFRVRKSELPGKPFPSEYEIPFAIGHVHVWAQVAYEIGRTPTSVKVVTSALEIHVTESGEWSVFTPDARQVYPSTGPIYGLFRDGYILFDSASAHRQPSHCSRHAHWFYSHATGSYVDTFIEAKLLLDEFFIYGPDYPALFRDFHEITGPVPIPCRKQFGFMQTQHLAEEGSQQKLLEVAARIRKLELPCDTLIIDFEWGDSAPGDASKPDWGRSLEWQANYTTPMAPDAFVRHLKDEHFDVVLIHHNVPEFASRKFDSWTCHTYPPAAWWAAIGRDLAQGVAGTWQDTRRNDPANSMIWLGMEERLAGERRPFLLANRDAIDTVSFSRVPAGGTAKDNQVGAHRYGVQWTGDIDMTWKEFRWQIEAITGSEGSLQGYPYLNSDTLARNWRLQVRWHQFTQLTMFSRAHHMKPWYEEWEKWLGDFEKFFVDDAGRIRSPEFEAATLETHAETPVDWSESPTEAIRAALALRYRLLPYIYSLAHENYLTGMPPLRPMLMAFDRDPNCSRNQWPHQYMLGSDLLVAPVCADVERTDVYLPAGSQWIDFFTLEMHEGGRVVCVDTRDIKTLPLFVRGGAVIATTTSRSWIDDSQPWTPLIYEVYPIACGESVLYEDDGISTEYQSGSVRLTHARLSSNANQNAWILQIDTSGERYRREAKERDVEVRLNLHPSAPSNILIDGAESEPTGGKCVSWEHDPVACRTVLRFRLLEGVPLHVEVQLV